ncbi:hypothetical protein [Aestuariivirga sp.]|uniref:hypothetical protein n=1 Tax=Aestuariivirga sp. TaxID=2650926 RepID=UPI0039E628E5
MQELINGIVAKSGIPREKVEEALGVIFNLIKTQGNSAKVAELFVMLPGVEELVRRQSGSLTGLLAGGMMGGPLAAITKLQALGLSTEQMREVGSAALAHARARAGDDLVRQCAANIPGISGFL